MTGVGLLDCWTVGVGREISPCLSGVGVLSNSEIRTVNKRCFLPNKFGIDA